VRQLPTGTNLSHTDFRVEGTGALEFCDPSNPQFIPVVAVRSPVAMQVATLDNVEARQGTAVQAVATLTTSSGKPIAPEDLLVTHTRKLHLLVLDPELQDYQHVHPEPGPQPGTWRFVFTPRAAGVYRVFADFTPSATTRGLYASADLAVAPAAGARPESAAYAVPAGIQFSLTPRTAPVRANVVTDFQFTATSSSGEAVRLEPVMDAYAHLVAVDHERSGFAHLHPAELTPIADATSRTASLNFKVTIPKAGRYVVWAQVRLDGRDVYAPFWFDVAP